MKIWWVVGWDNYYPEASLDNVIDTFATEQEAIEFAGNIKQHGHYISYEYNSKMISYNRHYEKVEVINVSDKLGINNERTN